MKSMILEWKINASDFEFKKNTTRQILEKTTRQFLI